MDSCSVAARLRAIQLPRREGGACVVVRPPDAIMVRRREEEEWMPWGKQLLEPLKTVVRHRKVRKPAIVRQRVSREDAFESRDRAARVDILARMETVRNSLPLPFLSLYGLELDLLRRTFRRLDALAAKVRHFYAKRAWKHWVAKNECALWKAFLHRTLAADRRRAAGLFMEIFQTLFYDKVLRRGFKIWRRTAAKQRNRQRRKRRHEKAQIIQHWIRKVLKMKKLRREQQLLLRRKKKKDFAVRRKKRLSTDDDDHEMKKELDEEKESLPAPVNRVALMRRRYKRGAPKKTVFSVGDFAGNLARAVRAEKKETAKPTSASKEHARRSQEKKEDEKRLLREERDIAASVAAAAQQLEVLAAQKQHMSRIAHCFLGLMALQRRTKAYLKPRRMSSQRIQKFWKKRRKRHLDDVKAADAAIARAVAFHAEAYLFLLLTEAQKKRLVLERRCAALLKKHLQRHVQRLREGRKASATTIQSAYRAKDARRRCDDNRRRLKRERDVMEASRKIANAWLDCRRRAALTLRFESRLLAKLAAARAADLDKAAKVLTKFGRGVLRNKALVRRLTVTRLKRCVEARTASRWASSTVIARARRASTGRKAFMARMRIIALKRNVREQARLRSEASLRIQEAWLDAKRRDEAPVRIIARKNLEQKRIKALESQAATVLQVAGRHFLGRGALRRLVAARVQRKVARERAAFRLQQATLVGRRYRAYRDRQVYRGMLRDKKLAEEAERQRLLEDMMARKLQKFTRSVLFRSLLERRFDAAFRRLEKEREHRRWVEAARLERNDAEAATENAVDALALVKLSAWKLGSDAEGLNYYYNWVTGESSKEKPDGWEPSDSDIWIKNVDTRGNVFYFNQLTGESAWFPPCSRCHQVEATKICFDCDQDHFCDACFLRTHDKDTDHEWRGADANKDALENGERHCLVCDQRKATLVCKVCRDSYCDACFAETHAKGALEKHETVPFDVAKKGWQEIKGRVDGEPTYYFNPTTGESTNDKPEALMQDDELVEHRRFKEFQKSANDLADKVEQLQIEIERLQYEKDTTLYTMQQQQATEHAELEELRQILLRDQSKPTTFSALKFLFKDPLRFYKERRDARRRRKRLYRKMLLLNKQQRQDAVDNHDGKKLEHSMAASLGSPVPSVSGASFLTGKQ